MSLDIRTLSFLTVSQNPLEVDISSSKGEESAA